jgi:uncharacterized protein (DUF1015 family)
MRIIKPFCAVRAKAKIEKKFSTKPVEFYKKNEIHEILKINPNSFFNIIKENIFPEKEISQNSRYLKVKNEYQKFKKLGLVVKDKIPGFYIQEISLGQDTFTGVVAAASISNHKNGIIKKHEETLKSRELIFKNYLKIIRFNSDPVLLTYQSWNMLSKLIENVKKKPPTSSIDFNENETQKLWYVHNKSEIKEFSKEFNKIKSLYIADGHHRIASSKLLSEQENNMKAKYVMAFLIPENELKIQEYNRILTNLNGISKEVLLDRLKEKFKVKAHKSFNACQKKSGFCMYMNKQLYSLSLLKNQIKLPSLLYKLDAHVLQEEILKPILGIKNITTNKIIYYSHRSDNMESIKTEVDKGNFTIGFGLKAVTVDQIKKIADANLSMPPKSTYILPKLRTGLTIYEL